MNILDKHHRDAQALEVLDVVGDRVQQLLPAGLAPLARETGERVFILGCDHGRKDWLVGGGGLKRFYQTLAPGPAWALAPLQWFCLLLCQIKKQAPRCVLRPDVVIAKSDLPREGAGACRGAGSHGRAGSRGLKKARTSAKNLSFSQQLWVV